EPYKPSAPLFQHNNKRCKGMEEGQHPSITILYPTRKTSIVKNKFDTLYTKLRGTALQEENKNSTYHEDTYCPA
ncbi:MAG: hypothetical protein IKM79_03485, partial [Bacteroidales bacterium]|nr:hypothetical protein [Bacteroidales bacterium]